MRAKAVVVALIALAVLSSLSIFTRGRGGPSEGQPAAPPVEVLMSFSGGDGDPTYFLEVVGDENFQIRSAPGGVRFFIDNDGNVGIGTTTPGSKLQVAGNILPASHQIDNLGSEDLAWDRVFAKRLTIVGSHFDIKHSGENITFEAEYGDFRFISNGTDRMTIENGTGNVGIGTTSPSRRLTIEDSGENLSFSFDGSNFLIEATDDFKFMDIDATNSMTVITIEGNGQGNAALKIKDGQYSGTWSEFQQNKQVFELDYGDTGTYTNLFNINPDGQDVDVRFEGVSDENLLFIDAGNNRIGIGTSSPSEKLHIVDTDNVALELESTGGSRIPALILKRTGDTYLDWRISNRGGRLYFGKSSDDGATWYDYLSIRGTQLEPTFRTYSTGAMLRIGGGDNITFDTYSTQWDERMRITEAGNVGIGTTAPDGLLHVGDQATNYLSIDTGGKTTLYGTARVRKRIYRKAGYDEIGVPQVTTTYNGIACGPAGLFTYGGVGGTKWYYRAFDDGQGPGRPEAAFTQFQLPLEYENGTDIDVVIEWASVSSVSGNVKWGVGVLSVGDGETYNAVATYVTSVESGPGTGYQRTSANFTFTGTNFQAGDDCAVVIYRDADDASDTLSGDAGVFNLAIEYTSNRFGQ